MESKKNSGNAGHAGFLKLLEEMKALHLKKANDYGSDTDPLANIRKCAEIGIEPWKGAWLRARDKVHRIDVFCLRGALNNEGVEDSLMDLAAYCLIALALKRETEGKKSLRSGCKCGGFNSVELISGKFFCENCRSPWEFVDDPTT